MESASSQWTGNSGNFRRFRALSNQNGPKPVLVQVWNSAEGILEEMRCSFCRDLVPAPLEWACTEGHPVCTDCSTDVPFCAWEPRWSRDARNMCRLNIVPTRLKLHDLIYNKSLFECPFKAYGCEAQPEGQFWEQHVQTCLYKPTHNA